MGARGSEFLGIDQRIEEVDAEVDADDQADDGFDHGYAAQSRSQALA
jgi:hypothetical protein